jgi:hypothetical protein
MGCSTENGLLLLSVLAFLMFGSPGDIGLDPHFEINPLDGQVVAIKCENRRFEVVKRVHALRSLFGRGTQVWIVVHSGLKYILKDSWVREDHIHNEVATLRRIKGHKGLEGHVPKLIYGGNVIINGVEDSIRRYRSAHCIHRIHRRIIISPVGEPITSFKSKKEFIQAMITITDSKSIPQIRINSLDALLIAHRYLYNHVGVLHSDLSVNNILLHREDNESAAVGLLIDYDHSIMMEVDSKDENQRDVRLIADNDSDTHAAEGPPVGERVAGASLHPSGQLVARAAHGLTLRKVRCTDLL